VRALARVIAAAALALTGVPLATGAEPISARLAPCLACHGEQGRSENPGVPSLGGQPEFYLTVQLLLFRDKLRVVELMNAVMQGFSNDDLRAMAASLAKLPPPPRMAQ